MPSAAALAFLAWSATIQADDSYLYRLGSIELQPLGQNDLEYGCGCIFGVPIGEKGIGRSLLQWLYDDDAKLRVNGRLHRLALHRVEPDAEISPPVLGSKKLFALSGDGIEVDLQCTTYFVCPPNSPECESTGFEGTMSIRIGPELVTFPVRGGCGC